MENGPILHSSPLTVSHLINHLCYNDYEECSESYFPDTAHLRNPYLDTSDEFKFFFILFYE